MLNTSLREVEQFAQSHTAGGTDLSHSPNLMPRAQLDLSHKFLMEIYQRRAQFQPQKHTISLGVGG